MALPNGKFKGKGLSLTINSVEYNFDVTDVNFVSEDADKDSTTFAEVDATGAQDWFMEVTAVQDMATGALWRYVWDNEGDTDVAYVYKQYGNATPSADKPHATGTLTIPAAPGFGGTADSTFTFEVRFALDAKPTLVTA